MGALRVQEHLLGLLRGPCTPPVAASYLRGMAASDLPRIDEHSVDVDAAPQQVWEAAVAAFRDLGTGGPGPLYARAIGAEPPRTAGWESGPAGATVPGFRVVTAEPPSLLVLEGRHRFSRYAIVLRVEPSGSGSTCRLESRAEFPGPHGAVYRAAVIGTRFHVLAVRGLLAGIRRRASAAGG